MDHKKHMFNTKEDGSPCEICEETEQISNEESFGEVRLSGSEDLDDIFGEEDHDGNDYDDEDFGDDSEQLEMDLDNENTKV